MFSEFMRLPKQVQGIIFKKEENGKKFLLLKRISSRGGFWQFVTGGVEDFDNSLKDSLIRELEEELNINDGEIIKTFEDVGVFEFNSKFNNKEQIIKEYVFGVEINPKSKIVIDKNEHEKFLWATQKEVLNLLKFENNKKAFESLIKIL